MRCDTRETLRCSRATPVREVTVDVKTQAQRNMRFPRREFLRMAGLAAAGLAVAPAASALAGWPVQSSYLVKRPDGTTVRVPGRVMALYQRAVIVWDRGIEQMTLNSLYDGEGDLFGCFGPVAADTQTRPATVALFEQLDRRVGRLSFAEFRSGPNAKYFQAPHEMIYNLELLRSMEEIRRWFKRNGFDMSAQKARVLTYYLDRGRIFFAALLSYEYGYRGGRVSVWTPPVFNRFRSERVWFPMKSTTAGDGTHSFISFDIVTPGRLGAIPPQYGVVFRGTIELDGRRYNLTRLEAKLTMAQMEEDLELQVT